MLHNTYKKNNRRTNRKKPGPGKRVSRTRQAKMREEQLKSTFHFGVKLIILLVVVMGCAQLFIYGKNRSLPDGIGTVIQAINSKIQDGKTLKDEPEARESDSVEQEDAQKQGAKEPDSGKQDETSGQVQTGPEATGQAGQNGSEQNESGQNGAEQAGSGQTGSGQDEAGQNSQITPWQDGPDGPGNNGMTGPWQISQTGPGQGSLTGPGQNDAAGQGAASVPAGVNGQSVAAPGADTTGVSVPVTDMPSAGPSAVSGNPSGELFPVSGPPDPSRPMIAFTFDDGPLYKVDQRILNVLQTYGGRGTFFIVGSRAENYKDTLNMIHNSGSEIGNHSFNHQNLEKISRDEVLSQIEMTNDAVEAITGFRPKLVRVPYGAFKGHVPELVAYPMIQWNIDTEDWANKDKDTIVSNVLSKAKDGSIVLMHDLYSTTADALEEIIPQLAAQGYQFVTVSEMYAAKGVPLEAGQVYFNIHN